MSPNTGDAIPHSIDAERSTAPLESSYVIDGTQLDDVVVPATVAELREIVASANERRRPLVPWGGGTQMGFGNLLREPAQVVDLRRLSAIVEYEPNDLTIAIQAGIGVGSLRDRLSENGQMLPIDAADPDRATLGGLFATGIAGPRRYGYGSLRDLVIGITSVLPDGRVAKGGGMVVKNVSGFDMMRLHYGALGSLGIIVQLNFKVLPRPRAQRTIVARFARLEQAATAAMAIRASQLGPTAIVVCDGAALDPEAETSSHWVLALRGEAPPAAAARQAQRFRDAVSSEAEEVSILEEQTETFWTRLNRTLAAAESSREIGVRFGVEPSGIQVLLERIDQALAELDAPGARVADFGSGLVYLRIVAGEDGVSKLSDIWRRLADVGDHRVLLTAPRTLKSWTDVFGPEPPGFAIMRELKQQFDPCSILNRGRFVGRL